MTTKTKLGQEPAFPCLEYNEGGSGNCITITFADGSKQYIPFKEGMNQRLFVACHMKDDFHELNTIIQEKIVGRRIPTFLRSPEKYLDWLLEGQTKWRLMQADALLKQESED